MRTNTGYVDWSRNKSTVWLISPRWLIYKVWRQITISLTRNMSSFPHIRRVIRVYVHGHRTSLNLSLLYKRVSKQKRTFTFPFPLIVRRGSQLEREQGHDYAQHARLMAATRWVDVLFVLQKDLFSLISRETMYCWAGIVTNSFCTTRYVFDPPKRSRY